VTKTIKIDFVDFWGGFPKNDNYFYHLLSQKYTVEIDTQDPDVVFFSVFGNEINRYSNHRSKKVFYTGENRRPPLEFCDMSFSFDSTDGKNVYLPLWVLFLNWFNVPFSHERDISYLHSIDDLTNEVSDLDSLLKQKTKFCSFVVKNPNSRLRVDFCKFMQTKVHVDCPGDVLNNCAPIGGRGDQIHKIDFLKPYRFNIAFENSFHQGYVTEKIVQPMFVRCIPVYWGGTESLKYFNTNSFVWCGDCETMDEAVDRVMRIENNRELYVEMIRHPVINHDALLSDFSPSVILQHMETLGIV
jgi:hypothetical protein